MKNKICSKKIIIFVLFLLLFTISLGNVCYAYFYTNGSFSGSKDIEITGFNPMINNSSSQSQSINLVDTITNSKNFGPGAEGKFKIDIDFSDADYDSYYKIDYDRSNLPNNLKFYVDEDYTSEFTSFEGVEYSYYSNRVAEHYIYWKWIVDDSASSNENDSLFMGQDISVDFNVYISQNIDERTVVINDYEGYTGRINIINTHTGNKKGSFTLSLTNIPSNTQFRIYFNDDELSSNLHLYSDSLYQNEINYIEDTYSGVYNYIYETVYWELETDNISTLSDGLYYTIVFGNW